MTKNELKDHEYGQFYRGYINACDNSELIEGLINNLEHTLQLFNSIPLDKQTYSYDTDKWTIKELLQHLIDSERVLAYRALRFARQDKTDLPGFEQDDYVLSSKANSRKYNDLIEEFKTLRNSSICLFKSFDKNMLLSVGTANNSVMSVRAIGFILVGHVAHHCKIINERYL